jgi:hypothetical protein
MAATSGPLRLHQYRGVVDFASFRIFCVASLSACHVLLTLIYCESNEGRASMELYDIMERAFDLDQLRKERCDSM